MFTDHSTHPHKPHAAAQPTEGVGRTDPALHSTAPAVSWPAAPPRLRVFAPDQADDVDDVPAPPPATLPTLRAWYERHLAPHIKKKTTRAEYLVALNHWERYTANPPLNEITSATVHAFRGCLIQRNLAPRTVNKTWGQLSPIFRHAADVEEAIPKVPKFVRVKEHEQEPRDVTIEEVDALYRSAHVATWPLCVEDPAELWRASFVAFWNLGPRRGELWGETPEQGWRRSQFVRGQITYHTPKIGVDLTRPVHPVLAEHLRRCPPGRDDRFFPATLCTSSFYKVWHAIVDEAAKLEPSVADVTPHDLRRSCQTQWDEVCDGYGDWVLGHRRKTVGEKYRATGRMVADRLRKNPKQYPQPAAFLEALRPADRSLPFDE